MNNGLRLISASQGLDTLFAASPQDLDAHFAAVHRYPTFPSAKVTVAGDRYFEAVALLRGTPQMFLDGETIVLPETERDAIIDLYLTDDTTRA